MHIAALVISLICAIFSLFQGGIAMIFGGAGAGLAEFVGEESSEMSLVAGFGALIFIAAFLGIIGGIFAALKKKAGWILLAVAAAITLLAGMGMHGGMETGVNDGFLYAIGYGLASFLAFRSCKAVRKTQQQSWICRTCRAENSMQSKFCSSCGAASIPVEHITEAALIGAGAADQSESRDSGSINRPASSVSGTKTIVWIVAAAGLMILLFLFMKEGPNREVPSNTKSLESQQVSHQTGQQGNTVRVVLNLSDGVRYEGEAIDGIPNGQGKFFLPDGSRYEGRSVDGKWNGRGIFFTSQGDRFEGEFTENELFGKGVMVTSQGDRYEGDFAHCAPNGYGVATLRNGKILRGRFENGKYVGP